MMKQTEIILAFSGTSHAIRGESILLQADFPVGVLPLPGEIRAGCGICLRLPADRAQAGLALLQRENIPVQAVFRRTASGGQTRYTPYQKEET